MNNGEKVGLGAIVTVVVVCGFLNLVRWVDGDPKYIPIVQGMITGGATLCGALIAILVWRFQISSPKYPMQLELYKRQIDVIINVLYRCQKMLSHAELLIQTGGGEESSDGRYLLRIRRTNNLLIKYKAIVPNIVAHQVVDYLMLNIRLRRKIINECRDGTDREVLGLIERSLDELVDICRSHVKTDEILKDTDKLFGTGAYDVKDKR